MNSNSNIVTKEDLNKALDNVNMWINNCDTKVSVLLGFYATVITIFLSTDFVKSQYDVLKKAIDHANFWRMVYVVFYVFTIIAFFVGVFELFRVIVPRIILKKNSNEEFESVLFYGAIAKQTPTFDEYRAAVSALTSETEVLDDLLFQIHSASIICNKKFERQKTGLFLSGVSIFVYFILAVIGTQLI